MGYRSLTATAWATGSCFGIAQEHHHAIILFLEKTCVRRPLPDPLEAEPATLLSQFKTLKSVPA
jgi:hypothetical protein